jgi:hypothetical protein
MCRACHHHPGDTLPGQGHRPGGELGTVAQVAANLMQRTLPWSPRAVGRGGTP